MIVDVIIILMLVATVRASTELKDQYVKPCDRGPCEPHQYCKPPPGGASNVQTVCVDCRPECGNPKPNIPQGCARYCEHYNKEVIPIAVHNKTLNENHRLRKEILDLQRLQQQSLQNKSAEKDREYKEILQNELEKLSNEKDKKRIEEIRVWRIVLIVSTSLLSIIIILLVILHSKTTRTYLFDKEWRNTAYRRLSFKRKNPSESESAVSEQSSTKKLITNTENNHTNMDNREDNKSFAVSGSDKEHTKIP